MNSISDIWINSKETFDSKSLSQILSFAGDGKLKDNNTTSNEFRELLDQVPFELLKQFSENCLTEKFDDSGFALQDVINQIGSRLGFEITNGLYRGRKNEIGYDGIWKSNEEFSIIVEVKTTDAYRINLDTIAEYRNRLIEQRQINKSNSSILIIVGRQDTGDLEAQIRGSRHAWDIRLLSTDSLLQLLALKEKLNDTKTIQQINELLKPKEYTRIDKLIDLIFLTSKDLEIEDSTESEEIFEDEDTESFEKDSIHTKATPVNFHEECLEKIQSKLEINLVKQTRISYSNKDKSVGLICSISKPHKQGQFEKFWFAFHPHQQEFLETFNNSFVSYGCGSPDNTFLIPFKFFKPLIRNLRMTTNTERMYWHVHIHHRFDKFILAQPVSGKGSEIEITEFKI